MNFVYRHADVAHEGWLDKTPKSHNKTKFREKWQRRYFILTKYRELLYVKKRPKAEGVKLKLRGRVLLRDSQVCNADVVTGGVFSFCVETSAFNLYLKGHSEQERAEWIQILSQVADDPVRKEAYLFKAPKSKGTDKFRKNWKRRWVVLRSTELFYYESRGDKEALGSMELSGGTIEVSDEITLDDFTFRIGVSDVYLYVRVSSEDERKAWMNAFRQALELANLNEQKRLARYSQSGSGNPSTALDVFGSQSSVESSAFSISSSSDVSELDIPRGISDISVMSDINELDESESSLKDLLNMSLDLVPKAKAIDEDAEYDSQEEAKDAFEVIPDLNSPRELQRDKILNQVHQVIDARYNPGKGRDTVIGRLGTVRRIKLEDILFTEKEPQLAKERLGRSVKRLSVVRQNVLSEALLKHVDLVKAMKDSNEVKKNKVGGNLGGKLIKSVEDKLEVARIRRSTGTKADGVISSGIPQEGNEIVMNDDEDNIQNILGEFLSSPADDSDGELLSAVITLSKTISGAEDSEDDDTEKDRYLDIELIIDGILAEIPGITSFSFDNHVFFKNQDKSSPHYSTMIKLLVESLAFNSILESISCVNCNLEDEFVVQFCKCVGRGSFSRLKKLDLSKNLFTSRGMGRLVKCLDLRKGPENRLSGLIHLNILEQRHKYLEKDMEERLVHILKDNTTMQKLEIRMSSEDLNILIKKYLARNCAAGVASHSDDEPVLQTSLEECIGHVVANKRTREGDSLNVSNDLPWKLLAPSLKMDLARGLRENTHIRVLKLVDCELTDSFLEALNESLKVNTCLETLDISGNMFSSRSLVGLGESLSVNSTLKQVHVGRQTLAQGAEGLSISQEFEFVDRIKDNEQLIIVEIDLQDENARLGLQKMIDRNCLAKLQLWDDEDDTAAPLKNIDFDESDSDDDF